MPQTRACFLELINYGDRILEFKEGEIKVSEFIFDELNHDKINFSNDFYRGVLEEYKSLGSNGEEININHFLHHENDKIQQLSILFVTRIFGIGVETINFVLEINGSMSTFSRKD